MHVCMCMHVYVCLYMPSLQLYIHKFTHMCVYIYTHTHIHVCIYTHIARTHTYTHTYTYRCVHAYIHKGIAVHIHIKDVYICKCTRICLCMYIIHTHYTSPYTCESSQYTYMCIYTHKSINAYTYIYGIKFLNVFYVNTFVHRKTYIHIHTYTYIHISYRSGMR